MFSDKGDELARQKTNHVLQQMKGSFADACITGHECLIEGMLGIPDPDDRHVVAAALKTRASVIVTDNKVHFPQEVLVPLDLEAKSADEFIADTIDLDVGRAVAAVRQMRESFKKPEMTADSLLVLMEKRGLTLTVDMLREHMASL